MPSFRKEHANTFSRLSVTLRLVCLVAALAAPSAIPAQTRSRPPAKPAPVQKPSPPAAPIVFAIKQIAVLVDPRIAESSGLAVSRANPNVFWTHNDSGDGPFFTLLTETVKP